jgi:hypothetical protein
LRCEWPSAGQAIKAKEASSPATEYYKKTKRREVECNRLGPVWPRSMGGVERTELCFSAPPAPSVLFTKQLFLSLLADKNSFSCASLWYSFPEAVFELSQRGPCKSILILQEMYPSADANQIKYLFIILF